MVRAAKFEWNEANQITSRGTASRRGSSSKRLPNDPLLVLSAQERGGEERVLCAGIHDAPRQDWRHHRAHREEET